MTKPTAERYGLFSWHDLGFGTNSDVLTASFADQSSSGTAAVLHLTKGHEYRMSLEEKSDAPHADGYLWPAIDNMWDCSIKIWNPYNHGWQSYSTTFVSPVTKDAALYLEVYKTGAGTYSLRNFRLDDLTIGTAGGEGKVNEPSLCTLESLGYSLDGGVLTVSSTDQNYGAGSPRKVNLVGGHTYLMRFEQIGSNMSAHINEDWSHPVSPCPQSFKWVTREGRITVPGAGIVPSTIMFFINDHSSVRVRNLYLQDVQFVNG